MSRLFTVPEKSSGYRRVVNIKPFNRFIYKKHFKMDNFDILRDLVRRGDWMVSIDLKYVSVSSY